MLIIGIAGTELNAQERRWLQHDACAGVILFARNFASKTQVAELSQAIRDAAPRASWTCFRIRRTWNRSRCSNGAETFRVATEGVK